MHTTICSSRRRTTRRCATRSTVSITSTQRISHVGWRRVSCSSSAVLLRIYTRRRSVGKSRFLCRSVTSSSRTRSSQRASLRRLRWLKSCSHTSSTSATRSALRQPFTSASTSSAPISSPSCPGNMALTISTCRTTFRASAGHSNGYVPSLARFSSAATLLNLYSQLATLEKEVRERSEKDKQQEKREEEEPIITPGMGGRLMITQGNGCVASHLAPVPPSNFLLL